MSDQPTMTRQEALALAALLNRTPMTLAEQLWVQALLNRLLVAEPLQTEAADGEVQ